MYNYDEECIYVFCFLLGLYSYIFKLLVVH